jgi:rhodanese-related sulfurtransferase
MKHLITLLFAAFMISCGNAQQNDDALANGTIMKTINATEAQVIIAENSDLQIIDVRTDGECAQGMIKGAVQINISDEDFKTKISELDKNGKYLVYCKAGGRSANAQKMMKKSGFTTVYNLDGGYMNWPVK